MGLIKFIRDRLQHRRVRARFRSYVDVALVQEIIDNPEGAYEPPKLREVEFALALVRAEELAGLPELLGRALALGRAHRGFIQAPTAPLVFVVFGAPAPDPEAAVHREAFAVALIETLGDRVKLLHGRGPALIGEVAGREGMYGIALGEFDGLLRELTGLAFGDVRLSIPTKG